MDTAANDSPEMIDYTSGTVMGAHVTVLKFRVPRKERRAVRNAAKALTNIHVYEKRAFRHSTFIFNDFETPADQQSPLHDIKQMFANVIIPRF